MTEDRRVVLGASVMGLVLVLAVLVVRHQVAEVSQAAALGHAEWLIRAARSSWQSREHGRPGQEELDAVIEDYRDHGLRYLAVVENGRVRRESGSPLGEFLTPNRLETVENRRRFVTPADRPPGPRPRRHLKSRSPPPDDSGEPHHRGPPRIQIVVEFVPELTQRLMRIANGLLGMALVVAGLLVGLAWRYSTSLQAGRVLQQKLEHGRQLAALGEASAVLAHEIRNPLASLKGHAQLLTEQLAPDSREGKKAQLVVDEAMRLEGLTNDLLEYVRGGDLLMTSEDPFAVLVGAASGLDPAGLTLTKGGEIAKCALNAPAMSRALGNVLRNAVEASDGAMVFATVAMTKSSLEYLVQDTGPGLPDGSVSSLFEPFVTHRTRGTGLGLSIAQRIVRRHGGEITARNHPEGGAEFKITIPVR